MKVVVNNKLDTHQIVWRQIDSNWSYWTMCKMQK